MFFNGNCVCVLCFPMCVVFRGETNASSDDRVQWAGHYDIEGVDREIN